MEPYIGEIIAAPQEVFLDFGNGTSRKVFAYDDAIFMNVRKIMENLTQVLKARGVKFVQNEVKSFHQILDKVIINCSGMGAKELLNDDKMIAVQGHLIMLKNSGLTENYMINEVLFAPGKTPLGLEVQRELYLIPKHSNTDDIGVIGGTHVKGEDHQHMNLQEFDLLINRARCWFDKTKCLF